MTIPFKLTVHQFAVCVQRCDEKIRREIRNHDIEAEGRPYLIHARELKKHQVDPELAIARLSAEGLLPVKYSYLVSDAPSQSFLPLPV